jgi:hypothetical protein
MNMDLVQNFCQIYQGGGRILCCKKNWAKEVK